MDGSLDAEITQALADLPDRRAETVRAVRRRFSKRLASEPEATVLELALHLIGSGDGISRFVAYELVHYHGVALARVDAAMLEQLGEGMASWEDTDVFGTYISGPVWREGQVEDDLIERWARSPDRWWRRAALVSTVALNTKARGGRGDTPRTLAICRMLIADRDDMVVKAMSWALRELSVRDRAAVEAFLEEHSGQLAARVVREVRNKLTTGLKNPRKS